MPNMAIEARVPQPWRKSAAGCAGLLMLGLLLLGCQSQPQQAAGADDVRFRQALTALQQARYREAELLLQELLAQQPALPGAWINLGHAHLGQAQAEAAENAFHQALQLRPDDCRALVPLGVMARQTGDFAQAEQFYRRCLAAAPDFREAHLNLGILYELYLGRLGDALAAYEQYQALLPEPDPRVAGWLLDLRRRLDAG